MRDRQYNWRSIYNCPLNNLSIKTFWIVISNGIIFNISKQIKIPACEPNRVFRQESSCLGVVVTGAVEIHGRLGVVFPAGEHKGLADITGAGNRDIPEGIVAVCLHHRTCRIAQSRNRSQAVGVVVIGRISCPALRLHRQRFIDVRFSKNFKLRFSQLITGSPD